MNSLKKILLKILCLNAVFLVFMSIFRLVFFFHYKSGIDLAGFGSDIVKAFYMGVRFDLSIVSYINILAILGLITFLCIGKIDYLKRFFAILKWYYTIMFGLLFILLCIDFGFYSYFTEHLNILAFGFFEDDTMALIVTMHENYNLFFVAFGFAVLFFALYTVSRIILTSSKIKEPLRINIFIRIFISLFLAFLVAAGARGSFEMYPLGVYSEVSGNTFLNKTAINAVFTLQNAIEARNIEKQGVDYIEITGYKNNIRLAFADFLNKDIKDIPQDHPEEALIRKTPYNQEIQDLKPNVIFIVMESFGSDILKYNSKEFNVLGGLKKHFDEDIVFYNFLQGHNATIGSLEAAIINVARRPGSTYLAQSKYAYKKFNFSGPIPYRLNGYETIFLYSGNSGWRNVRKFMENLGFEKGTGEAGMKKEYLRGPWGVYEEFLFDYAFETMESDDRRKFIYILTSTNHPPYTLPPNYTPLSLKIPKNLDGKITGRDLAIQRFETYQYSNEMLGRFITRIKNSKYADNTIIAVTGDHNFKNAYSYQDSERFNLQSVPFYLYIPKKIRPKNIDTSVFGSHLDIMTTLYNISLSNVEYMSMGVNLLSKEATNNMAASDGLLANRNFVVDYNVFSGAVLSYLWNKTKPREIVKSQELDGHKKMVDRYKAMLAVAEYMIKNTNND